MSGNGSIRANGETNEQRMARYLAERGDRPLTAKQQARLGQPLTEQHAAIVEDDLLRVGTTPSTVELTVTSDELILLVKEAKLITPAIFNVTDQTRTAEQVRSRVTRVLRLAGHQYSSVSRNGGLLVQVHE